MICKIKEALNFYLRPFIIILIFIIFKIFFFGTYFEEYEGLFSSAVKSVYTNSIIHGTDVNVHFIIMKIYFILNRYFPDYQIYGLVLVFYNFIIISFFGLVIYRILRVNLNIKNTLLFILLFSFLSTDSLLNLSTTRIAFLGCFALVGFIESIYFERNSISFNFIFIIILSLFLSLLRAEVVFISGVIYAILLLVFKRFRNILFSFSFLFFGFLSFASHYIIMTNVESEAKRVYYTHEKDLFDRRNIDYSDSSLHSLDVRAFLEYGISDKELYTDSFYNNQNMNNGMLSVLNGFTFNAFIHSMFNSFEDIYKSRISILAFIFIAILFLWKMQKIQWIFLFFCILIFPFLVCFNTIAPARFLVPYYISFSVIVLLIQIYLYTDKIKHIYIALLLLNIFIYVDVYNISQKYKRIDKLFIESRTKLELANKQYSSHGPIVVNNIDLEKFFPVNPFIKFKNTNTVFLNLYMLNSYEFYINKWKLLCNCNPLSYLDKVNYIIKSESYFIADPKYISFIKFYFLKKYNIKLSFNYITKFDENLVIYILK